MVLGIVSDSGGQPTGTTEFITASFIKDTASPSKKIWTSWPASANAFAWRKAKAAFVGSSEPQALLIRIFIGVSTISLPRSNRPIPPLGIRPRTGAARAADQRGDTPLGTLRRFLSRRTS